MARDIVTVFPLALRGTAASVPITAGPRGAIFLLEITAKAGTNPTLDVKVSAVVPGTGTLIDVAGAAFAQKTGEATAMLTVYPGVGETANVSVSDILPATYVVTGTVGGTDTPTFTYSVHAMAVD